jgi:hypothetical protein
MLKMSGKQVKSWIMNLIRALDTLLDSELNSRFLRIGGTRFLEYPAYIRGAHTQRLRQLSHARKLTGRPSVSHLFV